MALFVVLYCQCLSSSILSEMVCLVVLPTGLPQSSFERGLYYLRTSYTFARPNTQD